MKQKVLLAFSGGLDTSYCVKYLKHEQGLEIHSALVNTGGFSPAELVSIEEKAYHLGVESHRTLEETQAYYEQIVRFLIFGNVLKNGNYPLSVSAERMHQAAALAKEARRRGADFIAHGSTGAGNDQVRFDLVFQLLVPEIKILSPIRDQEVSRQQEIEFLASHGVNLPWKKAQYSINKGLWGTSIGGAETLTSHLQLPNDAYPNQLKQKAPEIVDLHFDKGELDGVNGRSLPAVKAIELIEQKASAFAIGRDIHTGDTIIGMKGRVGFEAAAAHVLIKAHHTLEKHTLSKWQMHWKQQLADWYGMFLHEAQFFDPVMRDIEGFLASTQNTVSGKVTVKLLPYRFEILGIESAHDLMQSGFGSYGESHSQWTGDDVRGFTKILANAMKINHSVNGNLNQYL